MNKMLVLGVWCLLTVVSILPNAVFGQEGKMIKLLAPQTDIGKPLMQVLKNRQSTREFSKEKLPLQTLSNLLWAAFGINRPVSGGRTAPSALNMQEIDVYAAMSDGLYLYDAKQNVLRCILTEDIRVLTGKQPFVKDAPLTLIFVADLSKMSKSDSQKIDYYSSADAAFISQNVYLFCASEGLATGVRDLVDKPVLEKAMKLRKDQKVIFAQTVGYPKK
ncbi:MAG: SagB/ThcOx family dehydrogenase [Elusimicrobiota bacterium]|nr:SagB/ThcOx family dehydrogenase [Elusimicrobiota bacterium]